jgi:hypothetical protein
LAGTWQECTGLTSFPKITFGKKMINASNAWRGCTGLTEFPDIDFTNVESLSYAWRDCIGLTEFPNIKVDHVYAFNYAWTGCTGLTSFPQLDYTKDGLWNGNPNKKSFYFAWQGCTGLTSFPPMDLSGPPTDHDIRYTWQDCTGLTSFPDIDMEHVTNCQYTWYGCISLAAFPPNVFDDCDATYLRNVFYNCALTSESVENILASLDTAGKSNGQVYLNGGTNAAPNKTVTFPYDNLIKKGWAIYSN